MITHAEAQARYAKTPKGRATLYAALRTYNEKHRDRYLAHKAVQNAVQRGKLVRQPCQECGDPKSEGHHFDGYADRLRVVWLCRGHHRQAHQDQEKVAA